MHVSVQEDKLRPLLSVTVLKPPERVAAMMTKRAMTHEQKHGKSLIYVLKPLGA
jgi:hypothetical protein